MNKMPLISVIVPVYNVEQYIERCVDSILCQTYSNLEIILVDDGSLDKCGEICDRYAKQDSRIRVIHKINGGLSDARNVALDMVTGEYIGFVDSDDWITPDMFEYLYNGIVNGKADISVCNYISAWKYKYILLHGYYKDIVYTSQEALKELFSEHLENFAWNKLFKRELWMDVRYPKGKNFEDILTTYKLFERANRIAVLREGKYFYERRDDSISGKKNHANRFHIYQAVVDRYRDVAPRLPQYRADLFSRIRKYYCHELSWEIVHNEENRALNWDCLEILSDFVKEEKELLYKQLNMSELERKKFDAFSMCSLEGCKLVLKYHNKLKKIKK